MAVVTVQVDSVGDATAVGDEVHVWQLPLCVSRPLVDDLAATLSRDETARAARFVFEELRARYTVAHGLVRRVLGAYLDADPRSLRFDVAPGGKPGLAGRELEFNLSHSRDAALLAVARSRNLGIDIEAIRPERDLLGLARTYFAPAEEAVLASLAGRERVAAFYRCWTRKEAYLKACGIGLGLRLDAFEVTLEPRDPPALRRSERASGEVERWSFADLPAPPAFTAALVVDGGPPAVVVRRLVAGDASLTR